MEHFLARKSHGGFSLGITSDQDLSIYYIISRKTCKDCAVLLLVDISCPKNETMSNLPSLFTAPLLQYLRQHPQLPKNTWYFIAAVTLTVINRPDEIPIIYKHALDHVTIQCEGQVKLDEELKVLRRMREALLKTSAVTGAPKVINACLALKEATPKHLQDIDGDISTTGRRVDISEVPSSQVLQKGQDFFDKVYGKISSRVTRMMNSSGTEDLDLIAKLMYGFILSNTTLLDQAETSYVLIAALIPQDVSYSNTFDPWILSMIGKSAVKGTSERGGERWGNTRRSQSRSRIRHTTM